MNQEQANLAVTGHQGTVWIGNVAYMAAPISDQDMATLKAELQRRLDPVAALEANLHKYKPETRASAMREALMLHTTGIPITPEIVATMLQKPDVATFAIWLCIRKCDPAFTLEKAQQIITPLNFAKVMDDLVKATGMDPEGKADGPTG